MIGRALISALLAAFAASACALPTEPAPAPVAGPTAKVEQPVAKTAPAAEAGPSAEVGRKIYASFCTRCHGVNLAVSSSAFYDLRTFPSSDKERFVRSVSKGVRAMPAWESIVKPEEIDAIWNYIGSVNGWSFSAIGQSGIAEKNQAR